MIKQAFSFNPKFYEGEKRKETIAETVDFWTLKKNTSKITARFHWALVTKQLKDESQIKRGDLNERSSKDNSGYSSIRLNTNIRESVLSLDPLPTILCKFNWGVLMGL